MQLLACDIEAIPCPVSNQILIDSTASELMINGGFSWEIFWMTSEYLILFWLTGISVGAIIAQMRRSRNF